MPHKIALSNFSVSSKEALIWGSTQHEDYLGSVGYDGLELTIARSRFMAELWLGRGATGLVTSLHQSFRSGGRLPGMIERIRAAEKPLLKLALEIGTAALMPHQRRGLDYAGMVQGRVGQPLPIVLYPNDGVARHHSLYGYNYNDLAGRFKKRLWQPSAEILQAWGVLGKNTLETVNGMVDAMQERGFDGICLDTYHWHTEQNGAKLPAWQEAVTLLAQGGHVQEVHFAPSRTDLGASPEELAAVVDGRVEQTVSGQMLRAVKENTPFDQTLYVVAEVFPHAIQQLEVPTRPMVHTRIAEEISYLVA